MTVFWPCAWYIHLWSVLADTDSLLSWLKLQTLNFAFIFSPGKEVGINLDSLKQCRIYWSSDKHKISIFQKHWRDFFLCHRSNILPWCSLLPVFSCLSCQPLSVNDNLSPEIAVTTHRHKHTFNNIREGWLENATTFREWVCDGHLFSFPHLICPWNNPVELTPGQRLLPPALSSSAQSTSSTISCTAQVLVSARSPDGLYRWAKLSAAPPKGLLIFLFLYLIISHSRASTFLVVIITYLPLILLPSA